MKREISARGGLNAHQPKPLCGKIAYLKVGTGAMTSKAESNFRYVNDVRVGDATAFGDLLTIL